LQRPSRQRIRSEATNKRKGVDDSRRIERVFDRESLLNPIPIQVLFGTGDEEQERIGRHRY
jgi:hypothetical protein